MADQEVPLTVSEREGEQGEQNGKRTRSTRGLPDRRQGAS